MSLLRARAAARLTAAIEATFTESATIHYRAFASDGRGGPAVTETTATVNCRRLVDASASQESLAAGSIQGTAAYTLLMPLGTTISRADRVVCGSETYEVLGSLPHTDNLCLRVSCVRVD